MSRVLWSRLRVGLGFVGCRGGRTRRRALVGRSFSVVVLVADGVAVGCDGWSLSAVGCFDRTLDDDK